MMSSKTFLLLALSAAAVVLISSEMAAGHLAETTTDINNAEVATQTTEAEVHVAIRYGGCRFGCCNIRIPGPACQRCCAYAGEEVDVVTHGDPHN
ncbi:glycine-rich protein-like [Herrania umbratica]|uniref:Glycine-rich protein-like n=1 Tax=Herrania umbratica TaxID=108875 RepID=A0A6J1AKA9_9ROSI|nr:glycine-rich protein-like [Herrania umbratica]